MERVQEITYPKPLDELLDAAYVEYCTKVPWASDYALSPKSVLRDMPGHLPSRVLSGPMIPGDLDSLPYRREC